MMEAVSDVLDVILEKNMERRGLTCIEAFDGLEGSTTGCKSTRAEISPATIMKEAMSLAKDIKEKLS